MLFENEPLRLDEVLGVLKLYRERRVVWYPRRRPGNEWKDPNGVAYRLRLTKDEILESIISKLSSGDLWKGPTDSLNPKNPSKKWIFLKRFVRFDGTSVELYIKISVPNQNELHIESFHESKRILEEGVYEQMP